MPSNNNIYKMSNAGGFKSLTRYYDMLAGNTTWNPWEPAGAYESIAVATGNGTASQITFSSIPSTYTHLQVRLLVRGVRSFASEQLYIRLNGDGNNNYAYHALYGDGGGVTSSAQTPANVFFLGEFPAANETANIYATAVIDLLDYTNNAKNKTFRSLEGYDNNNSGINNAKVWFGSGLWLNTTPVTSLTVLSNGAFASNSQIALYGIKG